MSGSRMGFGSSTIISGFFGYIKQVAKKLGLQQQDTFFRAIEAETSGSPEYHNAVVNLLNFLDIDYKDVNKNGIPDPPIDANFHNLKPEIYSRLSEMKSAWYSKTPEDMVITSADDGNRWKKDKNGNYERDNDGNPVKNGSLHHDGKAIDLRGRYLDYNNVNSRDQKGTEIHKVAQCLQDVLGNDYDVLVEISPTNRNFNHIHIEYDPKADSYPDDSKSKEVRVIVI